MLPLFFDLTFQRAVTLKTSLTMSLASKAPATEVGNIPRQNAFPVDANLYNCSKSDLEHVDEDEEEGDVDFNPFMKDSPSWEASSSVSSEIEALDADVSTGKGNKRVDLATHFSSLPPGQVQDYALGDSEHGEEIVMQPAISSGGALDKESDRASPARFKKRKAVLISQPENETFLRKENGSSSGTDVVNDVMVEDLANSSRPAVDTDDEDAISKRTRARYSLASFTLDELEAFLQETDDEDDLQNINEEDEYRKFLAAVLLGGDCDSQIIQGNESIDDEDEENDADFEIEIEEALESDLDDNTRGDTQQEREAAGRRPETRLIRRQKASVRPKNRLFGQPYRPLRPLLPNAPIASFPVVIPETAPHFLSLSGHDGFISGFTPHQLGQLHCLIYEHVQLLIQVFSLSVFEHSRQHIASQVQELISEILHARDQVISRRREPYPCFLFRPPHIHPTVQHGLGTARSSDKRKDCSLETNKGPLTGVISPSRRRGHASNDQDGLFQTSNSALCVPFVNGPILSVLDVALLHLVGEYIDDVAIAAKEYQLQRVQGVSDDHFKKEPLFPFHGSESLAEENAEILGGTTVPPAKVSSYAGGDQPPKKTLAAVLVESTKKQSIALVPKQIAELAQRFLPLFNPALFPHKPPPTPVANRVLFTDAEDELLAMGLMECNTDWKAIQQRFLPCKSKHQIFVRQKNRSSSKAPENPIKAVRRMKSSPLTAEEIARIQEGLKVYKLDWMSISRFVVPYRDPSLLPRQWRIATGTQKSYKSSADKKEKRRLYEFNRRKCKPAALASWRISSEKDDCPIDTPDGENYSGDDCVDNDDEAYVHEAFLADWRPGSSFPISARPPLPNIREKNQPGNLLLKWGSRVMEQTNNSGCGESLPKNNLELSAVIKYSQNPDNSSYFTHTRHPASPVEQNQPGSDMISRPSKSLFCSWPYRSRRPKSAHLVKLAPDLPPVNLPPSVRVMSQSALKSYQVGTSTKIAAADNRIRSAAAAKIASRFPGVGNPGSIHPIKSAETERNLLEKSNPHEAEKSNANQNRQESIVPGNKCVAGGRDDTYVHMHPLLFQSSGDGRMPYYPLNCGSGISSSLNFLSRIEPQLNVSLISNSDPANQADKSSKSKQTSFSGRIDFHPLLQKADDGSTDFVTARRGSCAQLQSSFDAVQSESRTKSSLLATCATSSSPNDKTNELDLEIHLSVTSRREKAKQITDVIEQDQMTSNLSGLGSGTTTETRAAIGSYYQHSENSPIASVPNRITKKIDSGPHTSSCNTSVGGVSNEGDQSLSEIVMEQEELSDSEEEIGEHVEFECEEMDDSEGDDPEQIIDIQNKGAPDSTTDRPSGLSSTSLISYAPGRAQNNMVKAKVPLDSTAIGGSASKNCPPPSRPNRSSRKPLINRKHVVEEHHDNSGK